MSVPAKYVEFVSPVLRRIPNDTAVTYQYLLTSGYAYQPLIEYPYVSDLAEAAKSDARPYFPTGSEMTATVSQLADTLSLPSPMPMYQQLEQQEQDIVKGGGTIGLHRLLESWRKDMSKVVVVLSEDIAAKARTRPSPSDGAKLSKYHITQESSRPDAVRNGRPHDFGPSAAIYHPFFAKFMQRMTEPSEHPPSDLSIAYRFVTQARAFYTTETDRQAALTFAMRKLIHRTFGTIVMVVDGKEVRPDGLMYSSHSVGKVDPVLLIMELQNEIGEGGCDPAAEAECFYVAINASANYAPLRRVSSCPAFIISMVGPYIQVSAALFADGFIRQPLTDYICLSPVLTPGKPALETVVRKVDHLFGVIRSCLPDIDGHYGDLESSGDASLPLSIVSPHFKTFPSRLPSGGTVTLEYTKHINADRNERAVFKAVATHIADKDTVQGHASRSHDVVVKFTPAYGKEGHQLLADKDLAPRLWYCEQVPEVGNMWVVVMDWVEEREGSLPADKLSAAVDALHNAGLVFGDLREPNVIRTEKGLMLVDFDWCGKENEARYPLAIDTSLVWAKGTVPGGLITKAHDEFMKAQLLM